MVFGMFMKRVLLALVLIYSNTNATMLLASQDEETESARTESRILAITYARAEEIASVLNGSDVVAASFKNRLQMTVNLGALDAEIKSLGPRKVTVDERSNSLLVRASPPDLERIERIIGELDVTPAQLLIEAVIVRLPMNDAPLLHVRSQGAPDPCSVLSGLTHFRVVPTTRFVSVNGTNEVTLPGRQLSYVARFGGDLDVATSVLGTNASVRILQRPRIQTSTGVSVTSFVAGNYPVYWGPGYYQSIQALQTNGSAIDLTCSITKEGLFLTDIHQESHIFAGNVYIANVGQVPITKKIESQAHITVRDRETIVLGGLIETVKTPIFSEISSFERIPWVGNFLNKLVTYPTRRVRYELIMLIRPMMLPVPELTAKSRLPLVRPVDADVQAEELKRLRRTEEGLKP
jgi:type II secretory pathway component GspD/PulD (secretin)